MRILIVDDNAAVRRGVAGILQSEKTWNVCGEAHDGNDALQKAADLIPDLILLDISMPGLGGLDVARRLRNNLPAVKILMMSQHDPAYMLPRALEAGAQGSVDKSRLSLDLVTAIRNVSGPETPIGKAG